MKYFKKNYRTRTLESCYRKKIISVSLIESELEWDYGELRDFLFYLLIIVAIN